MSTNLYKINDYVKIKMIEHDSEEVIGKIEEILEEDGEKIFRYNEYYFPEKTEAKRQPHNSKYEVYKTDEVEKEFYSNIICKLKVMKFDEFMQKLKDNNYKFEDNTYFFRQKYLVQQEITQPNLQKMKCCNEIFNPDLPFIQCRENNCRSYVHKSCFSKFMMKICPNCNSKMDENVGRNSNLNQTDSKVIDDSKMIGKKRERLDKNDEEIAKGNPSTEIHDPTSHGKKEDIKVYANLTDEGRNYLIQLIERLTKISTFSQSTNTIEKVRRITRDKICYALLYGIEEIKETNDFSKIKNNDLQICVKSEPSAIKLATNLGISIESAMWIQNGESNNMNYRNKNKMLYFNLIDSKNFDLRFSLLNKEIIPTDLVKMKAEELAPSSLKQERLERQQKYFNEQVLVKDDNKIITKNHKGVSIIVVNNGNAEDDPDFDNEDKVRKNSIAETKEKDRDRDRDRSEGRDRNNDNESDRGSWDLNSDKDLNISTEKVLHKTSSAFSNSKLNKKDSEHKLERGENTLLSIVSKKSKMDKEQKFTVLNISKNAQDFYNSLEEFSFDIMKKKINEKNRVLKPETLLELNKRRNPEYVSL